MVTYVRVEVGRFYEYEMAKFSKALMNPGFVQDQNEHNRMNRNILGLVMCVAYCLGLLLR